MHKATVLQTAALPDERRRESTEGGIRTRADALMRGAPYHLATSAWKIIRADNQVRVSGVEPLSSPYKSEVFYRWTTPAKMRVALHPAEVASRGDVSGRHGP